MLYTYEYHGLQCFCAGIYVCVCVYVFVYVFSDCYILHITLKL
jgi:hypothetical protein